MLVFFWLIIYYIILCLPYKIVERAEQRHATKLQQPQLSKGVQRRGRGRRKEWPPPPPNTSPAPSETNLHSIFAPERGGHKSTAVYVPAWRPTRTGSRPPSAASGPSSGRKKRRYRRRLWTGRRRRGPGGRACPVSGGPAFCMRRTCRWLCGDAASP